MNSGKNCEIPPYVVTGCAVFFGGGLVCGVVFPAVL